MSDANQCIPRLCLRETIAWCSAQPLENDPTESEEIKNRRRLASRAGELVQTLYRLHGDKAFRKPEYEEVKRLWAEADVSSIAPLDEQLRTIALRPVLDLCKTNGSSERAVIVDELAKKRVELLRKSGIYPDPSNYDTAEGRILLYAPDENLADGAARYASKGFFDVDNVPPWDTWVCYAGRNLITWVPPKLEGLANAGIDVNPEACITWATSHLVESVFGAPASFR